MLYRADDYRIQYTLRNIAKIDSVFCFNYYISFVIYSADIYIFYSILKYKWQTYVIQFKMNYQYNKTFHTCFTKR